MRFVSKSKGYNIVILISISIGVVLGYLLCADDDFNDNVGNIRRVFGVGVISAIAALEVGLVLLAFGARFGVSGLVSGIFACFAAGATSFAVCLRLVHR